MPKALRNALFLLTLLTSAVAAAPPQTDPDMKRLLDAWSALGGRSVRAMTPDQARSQPSLPAALPGLLKKLGKSTLPQSVAVVRSTTVPGQVGDLPARVYQPAGEGPFPLLVYFHGGGWVLGSIEDYDASARALANAAGCVVISVGYRQAPEHPYPAPLKDAYSAFSFVSKNADLFEGDPRRVAVGGEGSGANLAAAVCLMARDLRGRMPIHQLLIGPITTAATDSPAFRSNAAARPYGSADIRWFLSQYLAKASDRKSPYVALLSKSAVDLPPATIIVAGLDPLASQGEAYHKHLLAGAVDSQMGLYSGVTADFFGTGAVVGKARKAVQFAGKRLSKAFTLHRPYGGMRSPGPVSAPSDPQGEEEPEAEVSP